MLVYEVNLRVAPDAEAAFRDWLPGHVLDVLRCDGFVSATQFTDASPDPDGWTRLVVQYALADRAALDRYLEHDAPRLRADGMARFGERFAASRRLLTLDAVHPSPVWSK